MFVVANMIGTGVFTSLGFQVAAVPSAFPALLLWVVGGLVALAGALVYGELGAALPRSGCEYNLLRRSFHPAAGFAAGCVSATMGFAAPTALAAVAMATYLRPLFPGIEPVHFAAVVIVVFTGVHSLPVRWGSGINNFLTAAKILMVIAFCCMGFWAAGISSPLVPRPGDFGMLLSPGFAVSLVFVSYAYTGWNAAVYIVGDLQRPERLARALVAGTLLVTVLYFLVNFVILRSVPLDELAGRIEIGYLAAERILGATGGRVMAAVLGLVLASTVSAMVFLGPRVIRAMGEDEPFLRPLGHTNEGGIPHRALLLQLVVTLVLLYSGTFEQILLYAGFTLNLMTAATVAGVFRLRAGRIPGAVPGRFRTPLYPFVPLFFLGMSLWTLGYTLLERPAESLLGLATAAAGAVLYFAVRRPPPATPAGEYPAESRGEPPASDRASQGSVRAAASRCRR